MFIHKINFQFGIILDFLLRQQITTEMSHRFPHLELKCTSKKSYVFRWNNIWELQFFSFLFNAFCFIMFMMQLYTCTWLINQMYEVLARTFLLFLCSMINLAIAWFGVQIKVTVCAMKIRLFCWTMQFCLLLYTCKVS